jgi:AraC-like DNA-binding protein
MTLLAPPAPAPLREGRAPHPADAREVPPPFLLATSVYEPTHAIVWPEHRHEEHELLWSDRGVVTMVVDGRRWTVTPGVGLWIPAGVLHHGSTRDHTAVRATYFAPRPWTSSWDRPVAVAVNPAMRQLLIYLKRARMTIEQRVRAQQVCIDMLQTAEALHFDVPLPRDRRLAPLVEEVLRDPADDRSLEQWASVLNMTSRTITRAFVAEVAMSFARWRRLVRMHAALGDLGAGASVKVVARRVGYNSPSAFVAAFHKTIGCTPGDLAARL